MEPASKEAYRLLHEGTLALSKMESVGMPVCKQALDAAIFSVQTEIRQIEEELREDKEVYYHQRRIFGTKANVGSRDQLAHVLYDVVKIPHTPVLSEKTGKYKLDDEVLESIDTPYVRKFKRYNKLGKLLSTYLLPFQTERTEEGRVHGFVNLHTVKSYRSSFDSPNLQNIPVRDKEIGKIIRSVVKPASDDWVIIEADYSALEVYIAACYHKDPTMIEYLESGHDFHGEYTMKCFRLPQSQKDIRAHVKGLFTFAEFYGDSYFSIARNLWDYAQTAQLASGQKVVEHLAGQGITHLGTKDKEESTSFMSHIKEVDREFWNVSFPKYNRWRKDWFEAYQQNGYFHTLTGFRWWGVERRNFIINAPVQGSAFHCLLKAVIELTRLIEKKGMRSRLFCEIHDSILAVVPRDEVSEYIELARFVMEELVQRHWPWIVLGLKTEIEIGNTWADKMPEHKWRETNG